jgi:DNA-binding GntR family transcriptional regulator
MGERTDTLATRRSTLADRIYETLLDRLVSGRLLPGDHLVEPQLADELGFSRTPLRSALTRLVSEGLVERRNHCGCFVDHPTVEDLRRIFEVRAAIEPVAARLMATSATAGDLRALATLCEGLAAARGALDMAAYNRRDFRFHRHIIQGCGNRYLSDQGRAGALVLLSFMVPGYFEPLSGDLPWPPPEPEDGHLAVYRAILTGNTVAAETTMREHIETSSAVMQDYLRRQDEQKGETADGRREAAS